MESSTQHGLLHELWQSAEKNEKVETVPKVPLFAMAKIVKKVLRFILMDHVKWAVKL